MLNKATSRYKREVSMSESDTVKGIRVMSSNISSSMARRGLKDRC